MAAPGHSTGAAVLVAAGSGARLGAEVPKAFVRVAGRTLLEHALARFRQHPLITEVVVVVPAAQLDAAREQAPHVGIVAGGATRQASVALGLAALTGTGRFVLVHDVARPFVPAEVIDAVLGALAEGAGAVVPVLPVHDTIRRVDAGGVLAGVVDRASLVIVQTPQGFRREVLSDAHERASNPDATDDAGLVEALGGRAVAVPGSELSFKITTAADLARAEALGLGSGVDAHLSPERTEP